MQLDAAVVDRVLAMWKRWSAGEFHDDFPGVSVVEIGEHRWLRAPPFARERIGEHVPGDLDELISRLGDCVDSVGGVARLAYADDGTLRLEPADGLVPVADDDPRLARLEDASERYEWLEASADEPCTARVGVVEHDEIVAVATLQVWGDAVGHFGVFTRADARGRGLAGRTSSGAIALARARGLVPQWRSRFGNTASAAVADRLGFVALGKQVFVRVRAPGT